ncbi:recombinase family protein [Bradyrhizobium liaoningense]
MAAEYSRELSAKVYAGQCRFARLGYNPGGRAGYSLVRELVDERMQIRGVMRRGDRKYILTDHIRIKPGDPCEVTVVKWIFDRFLEVRSETVIAWGAQPERARLKHRDAMDARCDWYSSQKRGLYRKPHLQPKVSQVATEHRDQSAEEWLRSEGCIEPIIDREVFFSVGKIIEERRVDLLEKEMLVRLRRTLLREGRLSPNAG